METSVVIPTKNGEKWIGECLDAVHSQESVGQVEVLLVDSGSTDGTLQIARRYPVRIVEITAQDFHHARTRNYAATLTTGKYLVFLSQDAIPANESWLKAMLRNFEDETVGAVYGRQVPKAGSTSERHDALSTMYGSERVVKDASSKESLGYQYYHFSDVNAAIRREVWEAIRFPEEFKVFEDLGIAKRILDAGWKIVYEPDASVVHSHNHTTTELFKRYFDIGCTFRRLGIWNALTQSSMMRELEKLVRKKLRRNGNGERSAGARGIMNDIVKSAGFWLGVHERYLPLMVKRHLSAHQVFHESQ
jgi:glycosyltransferase involved in cell wall biosynthesis